MGPSTPIHEINKASIQGCTTRLATEQRQLRKIQDGISVV